jgi:transcriptional regulator with XRE-family HTH domain
MICDLTAYDCYAAADMTSNQYRQALKKLGLSQVRAAMFLGVSIRSAHGWANGENPVPEPVAMLLRVMIEYEIEPAALKDTSGRTIKEYQRSRI